MFNSLLKGISNRELKEGQNPVIFWYYRNHRISKRELKFQHGVKAPGEMKE